MATTPRSAQSVTSVPTFIGRRRVRQVGGGLALLAILMFTVFLALPSPIDPVAWAVPPPPERINILAPNNALDSSVVIGQGQLDEPEDVAVDAAGALYTGTRDGTIWKITHDVQGTASFTIFANTQGNPLGLRFDPVGNLVVADSQRGLLVIDPSATVTTLLTEVDGVPLHFTNDLDIADDGTIYFSDASSKFGNHGADPIRETLENRPHGRLIAYTPATGETRVLLPELYFANGVTLIENDSAVLVAELTRYRITRYWLTGERAGSADIFADNLPGMPDGIMSDRRGTVWVSFGSPRNATLDTLHRFPFLKRQMAKLPDAWLTAISNSDNYGLIIALNEQGQIIRSLSDSQGRFNGGISNVTPHNGTLYLGTRYGTGQIGIYTP